jgi:hypothetical protein
VKTNQHAINDDVFKSLSTVSPEEILAAGGATAFGVKTRKNAQELKKALRDVPKPEPLTDEEWETLVNELENDK